MARSDRSGLGLSSIRSDSARRGGGMRQRKCVAADVGERGESIRAMIEEKCEDDLQEAIFRLTTFESVWGGGTLWNGSRACCWAY